MGEVVQGRVGGFFFLHTVGKLFAADRSSGTLRVLRAMLPRSIPNNTRGQHRLSTSIQATHELALATPEPARPLPRRRLGMGWLNHLRALFGTPSRRRLAQAALQVNRIRYWEGQFSKLSDAD